ncbi:MAG: amino acid adenylation domain-containing protein [Gammaproteobacteria bacterium]|nr:amino acid adenylation domain-containing protein [Gammaproteobacteria bacterium]
MPDTTTDVRSARILIVDDIPANIDLLRMFLTSEGYRISFATNGEKALKIIEHAMPDLVLLDVMMPGMDGFEVCRILKSKPETEDLPVIFLTARTDIRDKVKGFKLDAADYITKPFAPEEVLARIGSHIKQQTRTAELRQRTLEAEQADLAKNALLANMGRELRTPLDAIVGYTDAIQGGAAEFSRHDTVPDLNKLHIAAKQLLYVVSGVLDYAKIDEGEATQEVAEFGLAELVRELTAAISPDIKAGNNLLEMSYPASIGHLSADRAKLKHILTNLLRNAAKYTSHGIIKFDVERTPETVRFQVVDTGIGITEEQLERITKPFEGTAASNACGGTGTGTGLAICNAYCRMMGGSMRIESKAGTGSVFVVYIPVMPQAPQKAAPPEVSSLSDLLAFEPSTAVGLLRRKASQQPDDLAYRFLPDGETGAISISYEELDRKARAIAALLQNRNAAGECALMLYSPGLEYITAFFGCLYAGVLAVPTYPPRRNRKGLRLRAIATDAQATVVLTTKASLSDMERLLVHAPELKTLNWLVTDDVDYGLAEQWDEPAIHGGTPAFLQYTSGSTGAPKGVAVTHANLLYNVRTIKQGFGCTDNTRVVSWLPLYHDMGLIGGVLGSLYLDAPCTLMSPTSFLRKPFRWLQAISQYRAVVSGAPNFAYDLCVKRTTPEQRASLDLSCWKVAFSGAEPVHAETMDRFTAAFASCGFRRQAFYPCYGMAEATLLVSGGDRNKPPVLCKADEAALGQNLVKLNPDSSKTIVGCGHNRLPQKIVIANPETLTRCAEDQVGEIWISGPGVALGYWKHPLETGKTFHARLADTGEGPFLRSGDLGFLQNGELFITGRLKDLIVIRGVNHYPQDIEATVEQSHPALYAGRCAVFSVDAEGEERLVAAVEIERRFRADRRDKAEAPPSAERRGGSIRRIPGKAASKLPQLCSAPNVHEAIASIRKAVAEQHELQAYAILLLRINSIPMTSSGKIQRNVCREEFLAGTLTVVAECRQSGDEPCASTAKNKPETVLPAQAERQTEETIQARLLAGVSARLKTAKEDIDIHEPLARYGLDSAAALSLTGELEEWLGRSLPASLTYDYPSIAALARYLTEGPQQQDKSAAPTAETLQEPIAVTGIACRFPGAKDPDAFWRLLRDGVDAISEVPASRWDIDAYYEQTPATPGKMNTRLGGFLAQEQIDRFDARFFGISPREAQSMDPQQRLLLELSWEALENAGHTADPDTGVFIGASNNDYALRFADPANIDAYSGTGNALSIIANRLSYLLDLRGPSWAVDTACSSSLAAIHQACQSLRLGECSQALAGGVNLILTPQLSVTFSQARMMAANGRCKTFDARADGYVRGEGGGIAVLKRLSDARRDGDNIIAIIRGTAVNQDGRSNGLTAPNGLSQQAVIRQAHRNAGVAATQISYIEAHGTGTPLGDPIEINALKQVLLPGRDSPCCIGSVKTNIGHLEAAAGIAGFLKTVLALQHGEIPPHLHLQELNPHIDLKDTFLSIPVRCQAWPGDKKTHLAGVSAFGFGGTNAHVVLEQAPPAPTPAPATEPERPAHLLTLSAADPQALRELALQYAGYLKSRPALSLGNLCFTANTGRARFAHRLAATAETEAQLSEKLDAFTAGREMPGIIFGQARTHSQKTAFLFTGQGAQYINMGRRLYDTCADFRKSIDRCAKILRPILEKPLLEVFYPQQEADQKTASLLDETAYTQPALFSIEYALAELWKSWGIQPDVVMGHSAGEYTAACVAGVFSLEDGLKLIAARGRLMQALPRDGEMAAILTDEARVAKAIAPYSREISIAAVNEPENIVISGRSQVLRLAVAALEAQGVETRKLKVSHAFHSPLMEPILADFEQIAEEIAYQAPKINFISNLTGKPAADEIAKPAYWRRHIRQPVRFAAGMESLKQQGCGVFMEMGPKPVLLGMGSRCLPDDANLWLPSLRQKTDDWQQLLQSLAELYVRGFPADWSGFDKARQRIPLPTYPFQRQRYWVNERPAAASGVSADRHPLLGRRLYLAALEGGEIRFESQISLQLPAFLKDHCVHQTAVFPAAAYLEMAFSAVTAVENKASDHAAQSAGTRFDGLLIEDLAMQQALVLPENAPKTLHLILDPDGPSKYSFRIFSLAADSENTPPAWTLHASGKVFSEAACGDSNIQNTDLAGLREKFTQEIPVADFYRRYQQQNIDYGPAFQAVRQVWRHEEQALGQILLPESLLADADDYLLHPVLLDACLQVTGAAFPDIAADTGEKNAYIPVGLERVTVFARVQTRLWSHARIRPLEGPARKSFVADLEIFNEDGRPAAAITGLLLKQIAPEALPGVSQKFLKTWLYEMKWRPRTRLRTAQEWMPAPEAIKASIAPQLGQLFSRLDLKAYKQALSRLEALSIAYILDALRQMGWAPQTGQRFTAPELAQQLGVTSLHRRMFERLLAMLEEERILHRAGEHWETVSVPAKTDPQAQKNALSAQSPAAKAELTLLHRCGSKLARVLRGECDPQQLIFPEGDLRGATALYQDSPDACLMNTLVQKAVVSALALLPAGQKIRILEIGAGTGGTTSYILPQLPVERTEYVFSDVSPLFSAQAREKFRDYPFMRYLLLDIEQPPAEQDTRQYDIIIAANVLHATEDLRRTLRHVRELLASGGMLVLLEGTAPMRWLDLIFGLTEEWWKFTDTDLRPRHSLLNASRWQTLLRENDLFTQAVTLLPERGDALSQQAVIVAQAGTAAPEAAPETKDWLVFADEQGTGKQLAALMKAKGLRCTLVFPGEVYEHPAPQFFRINPAREEDFRRLFEQAAAAENNSLSGVVYLWGLDKTEMESLGTEEPEAIAKIECSALLHIVRTPALAKKAPVPLWLATRGAVDAGSGPLAVAQSPLWGMGRVIALEYPDLWGGMIDLDPEKDETAALFAEILRPADEDHIAFRNGQRYVARLVRGKHPQSRKISLHADGVYLISGGLGFLGLRFAHWMAEQGARGLILIGRHGLPERDAWENLPENSETGKRVQAVRSLEAKGVSVTAYQADVADFAQMSEIFARIKAGSHPLRGIVHAAGILGDQTIPDITSEALDAVFRPKITGAWLLHQLSKEINLDFFVFFSSAGAMWGAVQAHYAAANYFLDMLAHHRRGLGLPALSVNWGLFSGEGGMADEKHRQWLRRIGVDELQPEQGFQTLLHLLGTDAVQSIVAKADWKVFKAAYKARRQQALLEELEVLEEPEEQRKQPPAQAERPDGILQRLQEAPAAERQTLLTAYLQERTAAALKLNASQLDEDQPLNNLGLDSLMAVELRNRIKTDLDVDVPVVKFMQGFSIVNLAAQIKVPAGHPVAPPAPKDEQKTSGMDKKIYPLSYGQRALWFLYQTAPASAAYNIAFATRIRSRTDVSALQHAFQTLVTRHPMLRAVFTVQDGKPVQEIADYQEVRFENIEASGWDWETLTRKVSEAYRRPFDLEQGSALRVELFTRTDSDHILLLTMHHIIGDFQSLLVLMDELRVIYQDRQVSLPPLDASYAEYVQGQTDMLASPEGKLLRTYWLEQLAGELPALNLPADRPRPPLQTYEGASYGFELSEKLTRQLHELTRAQGTTIFMTLLAAFQVLLYRYTGQEDIPTGSAVAGRDRSEYMGVTGYFVNPIVLRGKLSANLPFKDFLSQTRYTVLEALTHQEYPFPLLVEQLQPVRDPSRSPLFQVVFMYQKPQRAEEMLELLTAGSSKDKPVNWGGLQLQPFEMPQQEGQFDLNLETAEKGKLLLGAFKYNTDLFDKTTIARMAEHFRTLLESIVADPRQHISELPLLSEAERRQLLTEWNDTQKAYPQDKCLHQLIEAQVERTPEATAVVFEDKQLTYGELNIRANQLAHHLQTLGVGPEVLAGICVERSLEMIVCVLGILKAGGAYVPLDPTYPEERLAFMLKDAQMPILLTQEALLAKLPKTDARVICLDKDRETIFQGSSENLRSGITPENLSYVIYTSGSTGRPKGVAIAHRGVCNLAVAQARAFNIQPDSCILQFASFCFDASVSEIFMALCSGARLCLGTMENLLPGPSLTRLLQTQAVTHATFPPSALAVLPAEDFPALRAVIVAGEDCPPALAEQWSKGLRFFNAYGPTETTVCATIAECTGSSRKPPIGRPIDNTRVYILDPRLQPVPIGVPGELHISGVGLARGYLNRPELTEEKFIPDPFSGEADAHLYKTGDLVRYLADGNIEFLGRIDSQVKLRGFRIELGEIENVLTQYPGVREAAVIMREEASGDKRLVAYAVPDPEQEIGAGALRDFLKEKLPEYMVPSAFVMLEALPLTPSGKIDRHALPAPDKSGQISEAGFVAPRTPEEKLLTEIWSKVLGIERIGIHDNFFELGGHSLLVAQVMSQVRKRFSVKLPLRMLFEQPTAAELSQAIDRVRRHDADAVAATRSVVDLHAEAVLDPGISAAAAWDDLTCLTEPKAIFLTGASGFFGAFLLDELLKQTHADIFCLIRSSNAEEGKKKLKNILESYGLWDERADSRIIAVAGDLSQPLLGLPEPDFRSLAARIEVIYHNGAMVHFIHPYEELKAANVCGTQEILRLAAQAKVKPVHFISTVSIFPNYGDPTGEVIRESDIGDSQQLSSGYSQSKWVAEQLIMQARERGIPTCIYRPCRITGHSQTGITNTDDLFCREIKGCIQLGAVPTYSDERMDNLVTVDYVSRAIVHLSQRSESFGKNFHLGNPGSIRVRDMFRWIRSIGYPLKRSSYDRWLSELLCAEDNALQVLAPMFPEPEEKEPPFLMEMPVEKVIFEEITPRLDCKNTLEGLAGTGIECPVADPELFAVYFSYFWSCGFLKAPER